MLRTVNASAETSSANTMRISPQSTRYDLDLKTILTSFRRFRYLILIIISVFTGLAAYYTYNVTPAFRATSSLLIETQATNAVSIDELYRVDTQDKEYFLTQIEILRSRNLATRVIDKLNLWDHPELIGNKSSDKQKKPSLFYFLDSIVDSSIRLGRSALYKYRYIAYGEQPPIENSDPISETIATTEETATQSKDPNAPQILIESDANKLSQKARRDRAVERLMARTTIYPVRKTKVVKISYESADPELASQIASAIGLQYIARYRDAKNFNTNKASSWLNEQLKILKSRLSESEQKLIEYKKATGLVDLGGRVGRLNEQELLLLTKELSNAKSEQAAAYDVLREAGSLKTSTGALNTLASFQNDSIIQRLQVEIGIAKQHRGELTNRYGEKHPLVVDVDSKLKALKNLLDVNIQRVLGTLQQNHQLTQSRVASIEASITESRFGMQEIYSKALELKALESEVNTNQKLYNTFFVRITETKSADGLETTNASITDFAVPPAAPFKPRRVLIVTLAAITSTIFSMLLCLLLEKMNHTIRSTLDVELKIGAKLIGIVPIVKFGIFNRQRKLPLNPVRIPSKGRAAFTEAIDSIRAELLATNSDVLHKILLITSSEPGEGKSTVALNLAHSMAQQERVLLIDADMRRPTIARSIGVSDNAFGLSNAIRDPDTASQLILRRQLNSNLDILTAGSLPDNPLRSLLSRDFSKLLSRLAVEYDQVIIDSPPVHAVADAIVISKLCDSVIYIASSHKTQIDQVKQGLTRLRQANAAINGVIITNVDIERLSKYGGDKFYQGYYDMYGYTRHEDRYDMNHHEEPAKKKQIESVYVDVDVNTAKSASTNAARSVVS